MTLPVRWRKSDFERPAAEVARALIGCTLVRTADDGERLSGVIVETEAYVGPEDLASHAAGGRRTARNESMWAEPGTAYVYVSYGVHHCLNVSCYEKDHPAAVLFRAIEPVEGIARMRANREGETPRRRPLRDRDLGSGPGKLCQAMGIGIGQDGEDMLGSGSLAIEAGSGVGIGGKLPVSIQATPRIGLGACGEWKGAPLRFVWAGHPCRSR